MSEQMRGTILCLRGFHAVLNHCHYLTFAIYERNWIIFSLLAFLGFIIAASLIWLTLTQTAYALPLQLQFGPNTCDYNNSSSFNACKSHFLSGVDSLTVIADLASLVNFAAIALFDMLVLILTVSRTARFVKQIREAGVTGSTIFVLFRDGIFYYVAIFLPTIANVVLNAVVFNNTSYNVYNASVLLGYEINTLQILLVNRLVLNLSSTANAREELELRTRTGQEVPVFALGSVASVLETIGNPVRTLPDEMYDEMAGDGELVTPSDEEMRLRDANVLPRTSISGAVYQEG